MIRVALAVSAAVVAASPAAAAPPAAVFVTTARAGAEIVVVDVATGDRSIVDLTAYPTVIKVERAVVTPEGSVLLAAVNAAQGRVVMAWSPAGGSLTGVSGYVDAASSEPRGHGPFFDPGIGALAPGPWGVLYVLRERAGPMRVDLATGDRTIVSQSADPAVGTGIPLDDPTDMAVAPDGTLILPERLGGLVRVDPADGSRSLAHAFPDIVEAWHRVDRLPDGRLVHAVGRGDGREVSVFDRALAGRTELSGPGRGRGPAFAGIADLAVAPDGTVYVLDSALGAVLAVDPRTGDRTVVSSTALEIGSGPALPGAGASPFLARFAVPDRSVPRPLRRLLRP